MYTIYRYYMEFGVVKCSGAFLCKIDNHVDKNDQDQIDPQALKLKLKLKRLLYRNKLLAEKYMVQCSSKVATNR